MALVKTGGGIIDIRGSIAGNTFSRNRSGLYVRARVAPINPKTQRQSQIRAENALISTRWRTDLDQDQRDSWGVFAANVPAKNKLGEVINLSGFNQFRKSNIVSVHASLPFIDDAPVVFTLPGEDHTFIAAVDSVTGKITITFDDTREWLGEDGGALIVQMGIPTDPSIAFFDGPWRFAGSVDGDGITPPTSPDANIDAPYPVATGQRVVVRAKVLRADGRVSDWFRFDAIIS